MVNLATASGENTERVLASKAILSDSTHGLMSTGRLVFTKPESAQ